MSLAKQLADLDKPAPEDVDPEDLQLASAQLDADPSAGRGHYLEVGPSDLRKATDAVSDPKYDGVRISRKQLLQENDEEEEIDNSESQPSDDEAPPEPSSDEEHEGSNDEDDLQKDPEAHHLPPPSPRAAAATAPVPDDEELSSSLRRVREEERKKGKCVARQQSIFDTLVDARIRLQKCLSAINRLPNSSKLHTCLDSDAARSAADGVLHEATLLSEELFDFQAELLKANSLPDPPPRKRRRIDDEDPDWDEDVRSLTSHFSLLENSLHPHIVSTLQKWSNKVLAVDPSALMPSTRTKFLKGSEGPKSAVQLVDETLLDREKFLVRSREYKGKLTRLHQTADIDEESAPGEDAAMADDVFDDSDFYQQLLRDVIDARSGNSDAFESAADTWRAAQKQRKAKKVVDTRASKGRKLRFEVHEKLQNFMAPVLAPGGASVKWHESQIDELFASLLGRGYSDHTAQETRMEDDISPSLLHPALNDGFRVFG